MDTVGKISFYLESYWPAILLSLPYFAALALVGLLLVLRRASLFGLLVSGIAQYSFILTLGLLAAFGVSAQEMILSHEHAGALDALTLMDLLVLPLVVLHVLAVQIVGDRSRKNSEALYAVLLVAFTAATPLVHKLFSGTDAFLAKAYFTEILYTPLGTFKHYLGYLALAVALLLANYRRFVAAGFDPVYARLAGQDPRRSDLFFFALTALIVGIGVRVLGMYVAMAALLVPPMLALALLGRLRAVVSGAVLFVVLMALAGFFASFLLDNLPASPVMILTIALLSALLGGVGRLRRG